MSKRILFRYYINWDSSDHKRAPDHISLACVQETDTTDYLMDYIKLGDDIPYEIVLWKIDIPAKSIEREVATLNESNTVNKKALRGIRVLRDKKIFDYIPREPRWENIYIIVDLQRQSTDTQKCQCRRYRAQYKGIRKSPKERTIPNYTKMTLPELKVG